MPQRGGERRGKLKKFFSFNLKVYDLMTSKNFVSSAKQEIRVMLPQNVLSCLTISEAFLCCVVLLHPSIGHFVGKR